MSAPPQLFVELPEDTFDYFLDWKEAIGDTAPVSSSFTAEAQDTTLTGQIPANKVRSALKYFLGYSYADGGAPYALYRELPARHPDYPQLYAYSAAVTKFAPKSNPDNPNRETYIESPFLGTDDEPMYTAGYEQAWLTVKFKSWGRVRFLPDSDIGADYLSEYKRYCTFDTDPSMESLQADGSSQLKFAEHNTPIIAPPSTAADDPFGKAFPAPIAELMGKTALTLTWLQVPHNYLSTDPDILLLDKWLGKFSIGDTPNNYATWKYPPRLGTVNSDAFLSFAPGTLLLRAVKATPILYPVTTADPYDLAVGWNVQGVWEYFDPLKGATYNPVSSPWRGHRIFPYARSGYWYYATRDGTATGRELLPLTEHWKVFQNVSDPS